LRPIRLAHILAFDFGQFVAMPVNEIGEAHKQAASISSRQLAPRALESAPRCNNGRIDIVSPAACDPAGYRAGIGFWRAG
jgi:hypothetical protein